MRRNSNCSKEQEGISEFPEEWRSALINNTYWKEKHKIQLRKIDITNIEKLEFLR